MDHHSKIKGSWNWKGAFYLIQLPFMTDEEMEAQRNHQPTLDHPESKQQNQGENSDL